MTPSVNYTVRTQMSQMSMVISRVQMGVLPGRWADFAGGEVGHEEEEKGVGGDMKIKIH